MKREGESLPPIVIYFFQKTLIHIYRYTMCTFGNVKSKHNICIWKFSSSNQYLRKTCLYFYFVNMYKHNYYDGYTIQLNISTLENTAYPQNLQSGTKSRHNCIMRPHLRTKDI